LDGLASTLTRESHISSLNHPEIGRGGVGTKLPIAVGTSLGPAVVANVVIEVCHPGALVVDFQIVWLKTSATLNERHERNEDSRDQKGSCNILHCRFLFPQLKGN